MLSALKAQTPVSQPKRQRDYVTVITVCIVFAVTSICWFAHDHSWPYWDAAGHLAEAIHYSLLWHKFNLLSATWIHDFLTVSYYYPLTVHAFNGLLKLMLGHGRWVDGLSLIIFGTILNLSIFALAKLLFTDSLTAVLAVVLINVYPMVSTFSHVPMLDFPYLALYSLAVLSLIRWQRKPTMFRALVCGVAMSLASSSKQGAPLYLVAPCFMMWLHLIWNRRWQEFGQLSIAGLMVVMSLLIWIAPNHSNIHSLLKEYSTVLTHDQSLVTICVNNLYSYCISLYPMLSPLLLFLFLTACFVVKRNVYQKAWIPISGSIFGTFVLSMAPYGNAEARYTIAILVSTALISAVYLSSLVRSGSFWVRSFAFGILGLAALQFLLINFSPYPIPVFTKQRPLVLALTGSFCRGGDSTWRINTNPMPAGDNWCQDWIIDTISNAANDPCWVNIMPNTDQINVRTLNLATFYHDSLVKPTSSRVWTLKGDKVPDISDPIKKLWFQWFVVKTGTQGQFFFDRESQANYERALYLVEHSSNYRLFAKHVLPDNSELRLYWLQTKQDAGSMRTYH